MLIIKVILFKIWVELLRDIGVKNWPPGRNKFAVWKADSRFFSPDMPCVHRVKYRMDH